MKKLAAEFIGTFALVFAGTGAIVIDEVSAGAVTHVGVALTFWTDCPRDDLHGGRHIRGTFKSCG